VAHWFRTAVIFVVALLGLLAFFRWSRLRRRPEEEVILTTQLGTISRVRHFGQSGHTSHESELQGQFAAGRRV
jgi:hypothetical protein